MRILILSDIHYACDAEKARGDFRTKGITNPITRFIVGRWSDWLWEGDPFEKNEAFHRFLDRDYNVDLVVANGDYSADSAFIGIADDAAHESAQFVMAKLENKFGDRLISTIGDHELGKISPDGGRGNMAIAGLHRSHALPTVATQWKKQHDNLVIIGVNATLIALPALARDMLPEEVAEWQHHRKEHIDWINSTFDALGSDEQVILFCHDPTALPYLHEMKSVRNRLTQIEHTVIGHLHSQWILTTAGYISGFPIINFLGAGVQRVSHGLNQAKCWKDFNLLFCPALDGIKWHKGASVLLDIDAKDPERKKVTLLTV
ncbi:metallophosphoesterase [Verrucomicrobia bacterium]|nr:metallophosphoesterase [Verrucomicrobiota bacterium]